MDNDKEERDTLPPGPCDDACHDFEVMVHEYGENDARLERLKYLADADAREAYLRKS